MADRIFKEKDGWALGSDGVQWILFKERKGEDPWRCLSFVRSERDILARCMREKGTPAGVMRYLLEGLPETFDEWKTLPATSSGDFTGI